MEFLIGVGIAAIIVIVAIVVNKKKASKSSSNSISTGVNPKKGKEDRGE